MWSTLNNVTGAVTSRATRLATGVLESAAAVLEEDVSGRRTGKTRTFPALRAEPLPARDAVRQGEDEPDCRGRSGAQSLPAGREVRDLGSLRGRGGPRRVHLQLGRPRAPARCPAPSLPRRRLAGQHSLSEEGVARRRSGGAAGSESGRGPQDYPQPSRPPFPDDEDVRAVAGQPRPPSSRGRQNGWLSSATGYLQQVAQHVSGEATAGACAAWPLAPCAGAAIALLVPTLARTPACARSLWLSPPPGGGRAGADEAPADDAYRLREQLQRMKAELVESAHAQEEELGRQQQELSRQQQLHERRVAELHATVESLQQQLHQERTQGGAAAGAPPSAEALEAAREQGAQQAEARLQRRLEAQQQRCQQLEKELADATAAAAAAAAVGEGAKGAAAATAAADGSGLQQEPLQQERAQLRQRLQAAEAELAASAAQASELQAQLAQQQEQAGQQADALQQQLSHLQADFIRQQQELSAAQAASSSTHQLQAEVSQLQQQLAQQQQASQAQQQADAKGARQLQAEVARLQAELDLRQQEVEQLMEQLSDGAQEDAAEQLQLERQAHRSTKVTLQEVLQQLQQVGGRGPQLRGRCAAGALGPRHAPLLTCLACCRHPCRRRPRRRERPRRSRSAMHSGSGRWRWAAPAGCRRLHGGGPASAWRRPLALHQAHTHHQQSRLVR
jgi:hypothetical protein